MTTPQSDTPPTHSRTLTRTVGLWARELAIVVVGALIASTLLRVFIAQMFVIPSGSMESTLMVRDRVMVQKVIGWQRGDVVVFRDTQGWLAAPHEEENPVRRALIFIGLAPDESTNHLIKRVIAVAGDHVTCCDSQGRISVNGKALDERAYLYTDANGQQVAPSAVDFDIVVPAGTIFVMGDHRNDSQDSRCHLSDVDVGKSDGWAAFIPTANVVGNAVAVVYPFNRIHLVNREPAFDGIPAGQDPPAAPILVGPPVHC